MTIRGGGAPSVSMAFKPLCRMDPPLRNFAADAQGCIMVPIRRDRPHTSLWRDEWRPVASSPQVVMPQAAAREGYAIAVQGLTPNAPYKLMPVPIPGVNAENVEIKPGSIEIATI